jgi:hypothetical protein
MHNQMKEEHWRSITLEEKQRTGCNSFMAGFVLMLVSVTISVVMMYSLFRVLV